MAADEVNPDDLEIADELIAERRAEAPGQTPEDMTPWQRPITAAIDMINYRAGQIIALMLVPLIAVVVYEVFMRNSFAILQDAGYEDFARSLGLGPTLWVYDTSRMIAGVLFMAGAGYGLMRGVHIRADFLYRNWSDKTQATVDAVLYLLFFIPSMIFFTIATLVDRSSSWTGPNTATGLIEQNAMPGACIATQSRAARSRAARARGGWRTTAAAHGGRRASQSFGGKQ